MVELVRCLVFFAVEQILIPVMESSEYYDFGTYRLIVLRTLRLTYLISATACAIVSLSRIAVKLSKHVSVRRSKMLEKAN